MIADENPCFECLRIKSVRTNRMARISCVFFPQGNHETRHDCPEILDPGTDIRPNGDVGGVSRKVASKESGINHEEIVEASPAIPAPSIKKRRLLGL